MSFLVLALVALLIALLFSGLPISLGLILTCTIWLLVEGTDPSQPMSLIFWSYNKADLVSIPFFVLAAEILTRSGATSALVAAADLWFGRVRNGLAIVTLFSIMVFSAISGSSVATAMAVGRIMIPEMIAAGYDRRFTYGLVASAGGLGIIVPPSVPLIIYAAVAEISVADVFIATLWPGLLLSAVMCTYILVMGDRVRSTKGGADKWRSEGLSPEVRRRITVRGMPMVGFPFIILGGIYLGVVTATEAAALSVLLALFFSATIYREATPRNLWEQAVSAGGLSSSILLMMGASAVLSYIISLNRVPQLFASLIATYDIGPLTLLLCIVALLFVLGLFLEVISVILIVTPIVLPALRAIGIDLVHFSIILILTMELALITPPVGMNLFVVSGITRAPVAQVFRGCLPFILLVALVIAVLVVWKDFALLSLALLK